MKSGRAESSWNDIQCTYCGTGETAKLCISCCVPAADCKVLLLLLFSQLQKPQSCSGLPTAICLPMDPPAPATICGLSCCLPALDTAGFWIITANSIFWTLQLVWLKPALESLSCTASRVLGEDSCSRSSDPDKDGTCRAKSKLSCIQRDAQRLFLEC